MANNLSSRTLKSLSDAEYLEKSEANFFMESLITMCTKSKPDDPLAFAYQYFKKVRQCQHIVGSDYVSISSSRYNRRAFVHILQEAFQHIQGDEEMTASEFQQIVDLVWPDIPKNIVLDAAFAVHSTNKESPLKYPFATLKTSLYFHVLYEDWLKSIETIFAEQGTLNYLNISYVRSSLAAIRKTSAPYDLHPSEIIVDAALNQLQSSSASLGGEISFDDLRKAFVNLSSTVVTDEVNKIPFHASRFLEQTPVATTETTES